MKDFSTQNSKKLLEEVRVNGQDIYLDLNTRNMVEISKLAERVDEPAVVLEIAELLFTKESFELVQYMDVCDLSDLLDEALKTINEQEKSLTDRFKRAEE